MDRTGCIRPRLPALILASTLLALCAVAPAQAEPSGAVADSTFRPQSTVYFELLGSAVIYSLNYDYRATRHTAVRAGFEFGASSSKPCDTCSRRTDAAFAFPVTLSALIGAPGRGSLEIGGGAVFLAGAPFTDEIDPNIVFSTFVAFRLQPPEGGYFMRVGVGPVWDDKANWIIWPSLSLGYTF
jgi:hypothetical protein